VPIKRGGLVQLKIPARLTGGGALCMPQCAASAASLAPASPTGLGNLQHRRRAHRPLRLPGTRSSIAALHAAVPKVPQVSVPAHKSEIRRGLAVAPRKRQPVSQSGGSGSV
jgi:hypothetical protein